MKLLVAGAVLMAASTAVAYAADAVKPGQWEFTSRLEMANMPKLPPGVTLPPGVKLQPGGMNVTHRQCVNIEKAVPSDPRQECKMDHMQRNGGAVSWTTTCHTARGTVVASGRAQYNGNTMAATLNTRAPNGSGGFIDSTQHITGRYLGPCPK